MKKISILALAGVLGIVSLNAQAPTTAQLDASRICLSTYIPESIPANAKRILSQRLDQVVMKNGLGGSKNQRFIVTANAVELGKETTATAPIMYIINLSVNFVLGDGVEGTKFAATSMEVQGIGPSEAKAYADALKKIKVTNPIFKDFINTGKERIIDYYAKNCNFLLKEAQALADKKEFDQAISNLVQVPDVCEECYNLAMDKSVEIYKQKIEHDCQANVTNAKAEIAKNNWDGALQFLYGYTPDMGCYPEVEKLIVEIQDHRCADALARAQAAWASRDAQGAAEWLAEVSADSKCYSEAQKLQKDIAANLDEKDKREWEFKLKQHQDEVDITKASIKAVRDVGVAYAENQPSVIYNTVAINSWWW